MSAGPRVVFLRPRLGIGGGERLVVDAALSLQRRGCQVRVVVPDRGGRQFSEVAQERIPVTVRSSVFPESIGGRARVPLAVLRTLGAARALWGPDASPDLVFCDVVAHVIPFLRHMGSAPVLYYCHFPDLLLTPEAARTSALYRMYRRPINALERRGTRQADLVLVNSRFTAARLHAEIPGMARRDVRVLYPGVAPARVNRPALQGDAPAIQILSIARFDPRKNLLAALEAFALVRARVPAALASRLRLVLAGHTNQALPDERANLVRLRAATSDLGLAASVDFVISPSEDERDRLIAASWCVLYTPAEEHFGYVPLEAMAAGCPVVASNRGGPTETIVDGVTGLLCQPTSEGFAAALRRLVESPETANALGEAGPAHVAARFTLETFGDQLDGLVRELVRRGGAAPGRA